MSSKELVLHTAVTLVAAGKAEGAEEALSLATGLLAELERAWQAREARQTRTAARKAPGKAPGKSAARKAAPAARAAKPARAGGKTAAIKPLPLRALRVLQRIGVAGPDAAATPADLRDKVCEAHLFSAKNCGQATIQQIATWFRDHGETLVPECQTYADDWMTSRCDQPR